MTNIQILKKFVEHKASLIEKKYAPAEFYRGELSAYEYVLDKISDLEASLKDSEESPILDVIHELERRIAIYAEHWTTTNALGEARYLYSYINKMMRDVPYPTSTPQEELPDFKYDYQDYWISSWTPMHALFVQVEALTESVKLLSSKK